MQALAFTNKMTLVNSDSSHLVSFYTHAYAGTINRKKSLPPQSAGFPFFKLIICTRATHFILENHSYKNGQDP